MRVDKSPMVTQVVHTDYVWFLRLWGTALLFHIAANPTELLSGSAAGLLQVGLLLLAASIVWSPNVYRVALAAALQLPISIIKAPFIGNHEVILWLISLTLLLSILLRRHGWATLFVPAARAVIIVAYSFIAFSKLNTGFLDPATSCAAILGQEVGGMFGITVIGNVALSTVAIYATVIAEIAIPVLLLIRAKYGVIFALGFHFILALEPTSHIFDFSATLFPLFLLFMPTDFFQFANDRLGSMTRRLRPHLKTGAQLLLAIFLFPLITNAPDWLVAYPAWMLFGAAIIWLVFLYSRQDTSERQSQNRTGLFTPLHPVLAIVILLTMFNGLTPYLEVKTAYGFNMYSNLLTARGETNHLLIPATLHLSETQDQLVQVIETDDPGLGYYVDEDLWLPARSVQTYLADHPGVSATLSIDGDLVVVDGGDLPAALAGVPPGWFESKFQLFRALDVNEPKGCLRFWGRAY